MPIVEYTNFSGGVNQQIGPVVSDHGDGQALLYAEDAKNFEMSTTGLLKFKGYDNVLSSALSGTPTITGIFEYNNAGTLELIVCANGKVYKISGSTASQIYTGHTAGYYYQAVTYKDVLILCNGQDTPLYYDGATCTTITFTDPNSIWNSAKPKGAAVFRGRIFYWTDTKVYTPKPNTYNDFNNNDSSVDGFVVDSGYGGKISCCKPLTDDSLIIYKEKCIRRLSGSAPFGQPDQFVIRPVSDDVGCIAPRSVVQVGLDHYFWSERGPRRLQTVQAYGDVEISQPSYYIPTLLGDVTWSSAQNISAVYDPANGKILFSYPKSPSTTNNNVLSYDVDTQTNEPRYDGITAAVLGYYNRTVYHGNFSGQIYIHGTINSYDGSSIESYWKSKYIAHSGIGTLKRYRRLVLFSEADGTGDITVRWTVLQRGVPYVQTGTASIDNASNAWDSAVWGTAVWSVGETAVFHIKNLGKGSALKLEFLNTSATQRPIIRQVNVEYEVFGTNRG